MFGLFKKIFKKDEGTSAVVAPASPTAPAYSRTATPGQSNRPHSNPFTKPSAATPALPRGPVAVSGSFDTTVTPRKGAMVEKIPQAVTLSLDEIVPGLTHEFQSLFEGRKDTEVSFPLQVILPQLSTGRIRVSFGDLRSACPDGCCKAGPEHDAKLVDLPLAKVLSRVNPAFLPRKTQRPSMDVPEDVTGLFGETGEPLPSVAPAPRKPAAQPGSNAAPASAAVPPAAPPAKAAPSQAPLSAPVSMPIPSGIPKPKPNRKQAISDSDLGDIPSPFNFQQPAPAGEPPAAGIPAQSVEPPTPMPQHGFDPEPELNDQQPIKFSLSNPSEPAVVPEAIGADAPAVPAQTPATPVQPKLPPVPASKPAVPAAAKAPRPVVPGVVSRKDDDNFICVPVAQAQAEWPKAVQEEIQQYNCASAELALPYSEVDMAMRKGKIVFAWKTLRSWVTPSIASPVSSAADDEQLILPLKLVAPLFLKQRPSTAKRREVSAEEEQIPDLFSGGGGDEEPQAAVPAPAPVQTPASAPAPTSAAPAPKPRPVQPAPVAQSPASPPVSAGNPAELVRRTADMQGVSGALLAMSDGLMVASQLPQPLVGETVAAFLPQIFGRLNQFSSELKLGDLTSVMLVMDNSPWIIFRTGKIYFSVVGKPGEALPLPQLTAIVADIKRQNL